MRNPYVGKIIDLANIDLGVELASVDDWDRVEAELGVNLPQDYKDMISILGSGTFGDLVLLNPISSSRYSLLAKESVIGFHQGIARIAKTAGINLSLGTHGFLHIGGTSYGSELFIEVAVNPLPDYQICWLDLDLKKARILNMSLCHFLHDFYSGNLEGEDWDEERSIIWADQPFFTSAPGDRSGLREVDRLN